MYPNFIKMWKELKMQIVSFPEDNWIGGDKLEAILCKAILSISGKNLVHLHIPPRTKILIDTSLFLELHL